MFSRKTKRRFWFLVWFYVALCAWHSLFVFTSTLAQAVFLASFIGATYKLKQYVDGEI